MPPKQPIAIIGMAGKLPQADDLATFWSNIQNGKDGITEIPIERWDWRVYYGDNEANKTKIKWGGFLSDVDKFDARFFGIPPKEAEFIDPQHRLFLETSWRTIEDAGYRPSDLAGKAISVFVGISTQDYRKRMDHPDTEIDARIATGMAVSMLANRVSYLFDFCGPSDISDTACSSALVAVHRGIRSIVEEGCEMALVGGVNLILNPDGMIAFGNAGMLTEEKEVRAFDKKAQGYARGEGVGALLLKPLAQAIKDNDSIHAVILGSACNHSGRSYSLTAPNLKGQTQVITNAYQEAGISPETVNYLEAHGVATQLGDNIEVRAFKKAFSQLGHSNDQKICKIGALKPDIGHLEAASGIAALFKVILAMQHKIMPGVKNFEKLNPLIKLSDSPFYINNIHQAWPKSNKEKNELLPRRASVHSFGFSGVNAHIVLEEWETVAEIPAIESSPYLIVLSTKNKKSLQEMVLNLRHYLDIYQYSYLDSYLKKNTSLLNLAYTLQLGREAMETRLAIVACSVEDLQEKLAQWQKGNRAIPDVFFANDVPRDQNSEHTLFAADKENLQTLAKHWVAGKAIDWMPLYQSRTPRRLSGLPGYPFEKLRCWLPDPNLLEAFGNNNASLQTKVSLQDKDDAFSFPEKNQTGLISKLKTLLNQVSGYSESDFQEDQSFQSMGFDSLLLVAFNNQLRFHFSMALPLEVFAEHNSLEKLASYMEKQMSQNVFADLKQVLSHSFEQANSPALAPLLETYPVSSEQLRYWRNHQMIGEEALQQSLSVPICLEIQHNLDVSTFKKALMFVVRRQEVLRTIFLETSQGLEQQVLEHLEPSWSHWEIAPKDETGLQQSITDFTQLKWDLQQGPLWRIALIRQGNKNLLLLSLHHIIADLWSVQVFLHELSQLYHAWENRIANPLPSLSHRYVDFAYQETKLKFDPDFSIEQEKSKAYWQNLLMVPWQELPLPYKKDKQRQLKNPASQFTKQLEPALQQKVGEFCKTHNLTPFTLYLSVLELLLYALTEQKRLIVGTPLQNRNDLAWEPLIGCFANVSFTVLELKTTQTLPVLMEQVRDNIQNMRKYSLGLSETNSLLQKSRQDALCPTIQVMFNYIKSPPYLARLFEADSRLLPLKRSFLDFDLALTLNEDKEQVLLHLEYAENLFTAKTMQQFAMQYERITSWLIQSPESSLEEVFEPAHLPRKKSIHIAASYTAEPVKESLQYWMDALGESIPGAVDISFADFNQVFQVLLDPESVLRQNNNGMNVLMLRLSDWWEATENLLEIVTQWIAILQSVVKNSATPFLVLICPSPDTQGEELVSVVAEAELQIAEAELQIKEAFQASRQVAVLSPEQIQQCYPVAIVHDERLDELGVIPYQDEYFSALGSIIARQCFGQWHPPYKVLVIDGDHTLWQGIVADDGVEGICLDKGRFRFQEKLLSLQKNGILLALCSKNVEKNILDIFEKRKDFPLKKENFVAIIANWQAKSENINNLAKELNLGLDSFLFIDDNPLEIAEVEAQCPQVFCLQFPQETGQINTFVDHIWFFDQKSKTQEDNLRSRFYQQNSEREQLKTETPSYAEFINNLSLQIDIEMMTLPQIERVCQLIQRTNQFNSTTIRRSKHSIQNLIERPDYHIETVKVRDRFGDYGLVGLMVLRFSCQKAIVESLILSCRVLGRGVEHAMMSRAGSIALQKGLLEIEIRYNPSEKNTPILKFFKNISDLQSDPEGFYLLLNPQQLAAMDFNPALFSPENSDPIAVQNDLPQKRAQTRMALKWVEQWMTYSQMELLTQKIAKKRKQHFAEEFVAANTEIEHALTLIWQETLKIDSLGVTIAFYELGGTSLELVQVLDKIRKTFKVPLPLQMLSENSNIRFIGKAIQNYQETGDFSLSDSEYFPDLLSDAILPEDIKQQLVSLSNNVENIESKQEEKVLLTGCSGFLGAYLLKSLLDDTPFVICCLIRSKDAISGLQRIRDNMAAYNMGLDSTRIEVIPGDLTQKKLGLNEETYQRLSREVSRVYHNGALVNFAWPYAKLKPANVDGTQECLRFACTFRLKPFHYVSTASVFDSEHFQSVTNVKEEKLTEDGFQVYGGYAQSKWTAEMLVVRAGELGLPTSIYRPNGIGPAMNLNQTRFNISDAFSLVILSSLTIRKFFNLPLHIDFAPVDYIASAIVALSQKPGGVQIYSMTNPKPQSITEVQNKLGQLGEKVELLPYATWVSEISKYAEVVQNQKLLALLPLLQEPMSACGESWFEMSTHRPQFDCENTRQALRGSQISCPEINTDNLMKLLLLAFVTINYLESTQVIKPYLYSDLLSSKALSQRENSVSQTKKAIILSWSLGSGHNASALAMVSSLQQKEGLEVEIVDLGKWASYVHNLDSFWKHLSRHNIPQLQAYTELTQASQQHEMVLFRQIYETTAQQLMAYYQPDMVISVCPLGCQLLRYFKHISPQLPTITYVSDWLGGVYKEWGDSGADLIYSPSNECSRFLMENCADQSDLGDKLITGSLIMGDGFSNLLSSQNIATSRSQLRKKWGIGETEKVLLFNSYGNEQSLELLKNLPIELPPFRVIVLCYNNENVLKKTQTLGKTFPGNIEGRLWLDDLSECLLLSDVLFSKSGPGICAEALITDTVIFLNAMEGIMPQEIGIHHKVLNEELGLNIEVADDFNNALYDWLGCQTRYAKILNNVKNQKVLNGCQDFCQKVLEKLS